MFSHVRTYFITCTSVIHILIGILLTVSYICVHVITSLFCTNETFTMKNHATIISNMNISSWSPNVLTLCLFVVTWSIPIYIHVNVQDPQNAELHRPLRAISPSKDNIFKVSMTTYVCTHHINILIRWK